jgi:Tfp pilus assembly protein PilF
METFLETHKNNGQAWVYTAIIYNQMEENDKAWDVIGEAKKYLPNDTLVEKQYKFLYQKKFVEPFRKEYITAREYYNKKDYSNALTYLDRFIGNVPDYIDARSLRAYVYYYLNDYRKSIEEANYAINLSEDTGTLINLRGVCYRALKDMDAACKDFEKAMQMGDKDGKTNFERFCNAKPQ